MEYVLGLELTDHTLLRMAQRNISISDLQIVVGFGKEFHRHGAVLRILRAKDLPADSWRDSRVTRLIGMVAVISSDGCVITVYRARKFGNSRIRRKARRQTRSSRSSAYAF